MDLRGAIIDGKQYGVVSDIKEYTSQQNIPEQISVEENILSPFNPQTIMSLCLKNGFRLRNAQKNS